MAGPVTEIITIASTLKTVKAGSLESKAELGPFPSATETAPIHRICEEAIVSRNIATVVLVRPVHPLFKSELNQSQGIEDMTTKDERFLNVVYVADGNFLPHVGASLVSLAENAGEDILKVFVGVEKASRIRVARLKKTGRKLFGHRFHLVFLDDKALPLMRTRLHISSTAHKRFLVDKIVHPTDSHVLYLDGDTLVCSRLSSLSALTEEIASGGDDVQPALWASRDFSPSKLHGSKIFSGDLFNSGVMLINLHKWRRRAPLEDLIKVSLEHETLINGDQDALNLVFQDQWAEIGSHYNSTDRNGPEQSSAIIKHFTGSDKPWSWGTQHPWKQLYEAYRRKSGFWPYLPTVLWFRVRRRLIRRLIDPIYLFLRR